MQACVGVAFAFLEVGDDVVAGLLVDKLRQHALGGVAGEDGPGVPEELLDDLRCQGRSRLYRQTLGASTAGAVCAVCWRRLPETTARACPGAAFRAGGVIRHLHPGGRCDVLNEPVPGSASRQSLRAMAGVVSAPGCTQKGRRRFSHSGAPAAKDSMVMAGEGHRKHLARSRRRTGRFAHDSFTQAPRRAMRPWGSPWMARISPARSSSASARSWRACWAASYS